MKRNNRGNRNNRNNRNFRRILLSPPLRIISFRSLSLLSISIFIIILQTLCPQIMSPPQSSSPFFTFSQQQVRMFSAHKQQCTVTDYAKYIPEFFECTRPHVPYKRGIGKLHEVSGKETDWEKYMRKVREAAVTNFLDIDQELFTMTREVLQIWDLQPYPPQFFHNALCNPDSKEWLQWSDPDKYTKDYFQQVPSWSLC